MKNAISYLRFSSPKQAGNDSYRRQIEATERFCKANDLCLSDRLEDLGVSAWTGKNLGDDAALGGFLKLVEAGKIPRQTVLIVENLDRLSRGKIIDALTLFTSIIKQGIEIVTTMDGKWYSEKSISDNPTDLMVSIIYLTRGNNESETKSLRVKEAWKNKRVKIKMGQFVRMRSYFWLEHDGQGWKLNEEHAAKVRLIFDLYNRGYGVFNILKELDKRNIKAFGKTPAWKLTLIYNLLDNPATIGVCDRVTPPVANYYPPVISQETYYKAQSQRKQNQGFSGKTGTQKVNIFSGLCKCAKCGENMIKYVSNGNQYSSKKYHYLICSAAKLGKHKHEFAPFDKFNDSFMAVLNMVNFSKILFANQPEIDDESEIIHGRLAGLQKTIDRVADAIVKSDNPDLVVRLTDLEIERKNLEIAYKAAVTANMSKTDVRKDYRDMVAGLRQNINDNAFRLKLRNLMRKHIKEIIVNAKEYTVRFKGNGNVSNDDIHIVLDNTSFQMAYWDEVEVHDYAA